VIEISQREMKTLPGTSTPGSSDWEPGCCPSRQPRGCSRLPAHRAARNTASCSQQPGQRRTANQHRKPRLTARQDCRRTHGSVGKTVVPGNSPRAPERLQFLCNFIHTIICVCVCVYI